MNLRRKAWENFLYSLPQTTKCYVNVISSDSEWLHTFLLCLAICWQAKWKPSLRLIEFAFVIEQKFYGFWPYTISHLSYAQVINKLWDICSDGFIDGGVKSVEQSNRLQWENPKPYYVRRCPGGAAISTTSRWSLHWANNHHPGLCHDRDELSMAWIRKTSNIRHRPTSELENLGENQPAFCPRSAKFANTKTLLASSPVSCDYLGVHFFFLWHWFTPSPF